MQLDFDTDCTGHRSRHPSPFPFSEIATEIINEVNRNKKKQPTFVQFAHDLAIEMRMGKGVDDLRSQLPPAVTLPWRLLIPKSCKDKLTKYASRFLVFLFVDHLPPGERKQWALRNVDWNGVQESPQRTPEAFVNWYFDGQAYKNSKRMCVDIADKRPRHERQQQHQHQHHQQQLANTAAMPCLPNHLFASAQPAASFLPYGGVWNADCSASFQPAALDESAFAPSVTTNQLFFGVTDEPCIMAFDGWAHAAQQYGNILMQPAVLQAAPLQPSPAPAVLNDSEPHISPMGFASEITGMGELIGDYQPEVDMFISDY